MTRHYFTSLTRIAPLPEQNFEVQRLPRPHWAAGDYVAAEVTDASGIRHIELRNGRLIDLAEGDLVIGAFGDRFATLEATGSWQDIGRDGFMHMLTGAGLLGKSRSKSMMLPSLMGLQYAGHVLVRGEKAVMQDYVETVPPRPYLIPTVLLIGTSMSAGKTTAGRVLVRQLKKAGLRVVAAKLTGAGRYRDILTMHDAGADYVFDFVDVGFPSTVCPEAEFRRGLPQLLSRIAATDAEVAVVEIGASPLEPYNGAAAIEAIAPHVRFTVLCASDPYAVVGVLTAYEGQHPDLVSGIVTNTEAGVALIQRLSGLRGLNLLDKRALPALRALLFEKLGIEPARAVQAPSFDKRAPAAFASWPVA